jgi:hypothetical protein
MIYLGLHLALAVTLLFTRAIRAAGADPARRRRLSRLLLVGALASPFAVNLLPAPARSLAPAQVWSSAGRGTPGGAVFQLGARPATALPGVSFPSGELLLALLAALVVAALALDALALRRRLQGAMTIRRIGRLRIAISPTETSPWTAAFLRTGWIVLDRATAADPRLRRLALLHELQHLRARDGHWAWVLAALQPAFLWSPVARWLRAAMVECEELACDAALVARGRVAARAYAAALLDVAERGLSSAPSASPALQGFSLLHRRIDMLISKPRSGRPALDAVLVALALALVCVAARAADAVVADHRIDQQRAQEAARRVAAGPEFPVVVNDVVLAELNRLVATPGGRRFTQAALELRPKQLGTIRDALAAQKLPPQLDAVPLIESGYQNIDAGEHGAGLWQFVVPTARKYGLHVSPPTDDRMNPVLEAAAAARLLGDLRRQFGDWPLALAAYTQGEHRVQAAMDREGTRDAWELIRRRALDPYPAKVMAAVLVIADPSLAGR